MFLYFLISVSIGIEGGYSLPAAGLNNLKSGNVLAIYTQHHTGLAEVKLMLGSSFYSGTNRGYALNFYGLKCGVTKDGWRISPLIELGTDYVNRKLGAAKETGLTLNYTIGCVVNFRVNGLGIYPKIYYRGITDFRTQAAFLGLLLGISYEI